MTPESGEKREDELLKIRVKRLENALRWIPTLPRRMRSSSGQLRDWVELALGVQHDECLLEKRRGQAVTTKEEAGKEGGPIWADGYQRLISFGRNHSGQYSGELDYSIAAMRVERLSSVDRVELIRLLDAAKEFVEGLP